MEITFLKCASVKSLGIMRLSIKTMFVEYILYFVNGMIAYDKYA